MGKKPLMSVVTLQVWNALKRPPIHHPLFRRISRNRPLVPQRHLSLKLRIGLSILLAALFFLILQNFAQVIFIGLFFIPLGITALYMTLNGTLAGLYWATRVSSAIARERERGIYDLLSTSPYGAFSASWAICTGCQYYDQTFNGTGAQRVWFSRMFFLTLLLFSAIISLGNTRTFSGDTLEGFLNVLEIVVVLAAAFYIDDIHSTVIGSLVGLIIPLFARNRLDARIGAFVSFLLLQISAFTLVWIIGFQTMPQINASLALNGFAAEIALPLELLLVFFAVREGIARVLWRLNSLLLDGDVSDLRLLTKGGRLIC